MGTPMCTPPYSNILSCFIIEKEAITHWGILPRSTLNNRTEKGLLKWVHLSGGVPFFTSDPLDLFTADGPTFLGLTARMRQYP